MSSSALFATRRPTTERAPKAQRLLGTAFTVFAVVAYGCLIRDSNGEDEAFALVIPLIGLVASAFLLHSSHLGRQLLARAAWWSSLILGVIISGAAGSHESQWAMMLALGAGGALLVMGRRGVSDAKQRGDFVPVAFTGALTAGLVMAMADLQTLALWGGLALTFETGTGIVLLSCAALMLVAIVGLYRLRMWGVVLNIGANVVIATLALTVVDLPPVISYTLAATAIAQLLLPLPMLLSMLRKGAPRPAAKYTWLFAPVVVSALMFAAILMQGTRVLD